MCAFDGVMGVCVYVCVCLGYNSRTIKLTILKCTIQWFLIYSQGYAIITNI